MLLLLLTAITNPSLAARDALPRGVSPQVCHGLDSRRETRGMYLLDSGRWDVHKGGPADKVRPA
jgi:hypothetical protein